MMEGRLTPALAVPDAEFFSGEIRSIVASFNTYRDESEIMIGGDVRVRATGPGDGRFQIIDSTTNEVLFDEQPFGESFRGGLEIAAGDFRYLTVAGRAVTLLGPSDSLVVAAGSGGAARVKILDFDKGQLATRADFIGVGGPTFRGGASIAVGDFNRDSNLDLAVGAGPGGGPRVAVYDNQQQHGTQPVAYADFFAFSDPTFRGGVSLAAGRYVQENNILFQQAADPSGTYPIDYVRGADLAVGAGPGGAPRVLIYNGILLGTNVKPIADFFVKGDSTSRGGVRISSPVQSSHDVSQTIRFERPGFEPVEKYYGPAPLL